MAELTGTGEWVGGEALADPSTARAVRVRDGIPAVTDGPFALYDLLERVAPSPVVTLNRGVAVAMVNGPQAGLDALARLEGDGPMAGHHRVAGLRAHFHELAGQREAAVADYQLAAQRATSLPERRYLESRAARLAGHG
jgi:predicted RNA polymerase sigma factor